MALITPDYLQTKSYAAKRDRRVNQALIMQEGIVQAGDFKVSQRGAGANMSVDVAAGESWVDGDAAVDQGFYHVVNDATVNVAIANNASGNPRIDTIILKVNDSADAGSGTDIPALEVVQGTPTAAATLANLNGIAALPATALRLAYVLVANGAVKIENAQIGNLKDPRAGTTGYPAVAEPKALTLAPPQYAHGRALGYVPCAIGVRAAEQTVITTTNTPIEFSAADELDNEEIHNSASESSKFICRTPGLYQVHASVIWSAVLTGRLFFSRNAEVFANSAYGSDQYMSNSTHMRLGYGDAVTISVFHQTGSNKTILARGSIMWQGP